MERIYGWMKQNLSISLNRRMVAVEKTIQEDEHEKVVGRLELSEQKKDEEENIHKIRPSLRCFTNPRKGFFLEYGAEISIDRDVKSISEMFSLKPVLGVGHRMNVSRRWFMEARVDLLYYKEDEDENKNKINVDVKPSISVGFNI